MVQRDKSFLPDHLFRGFSGNVCADVAIKQGLLKLEKDYGLNVHCLLFCCWVACRGSSLGKQDMCLLLEVVFPWHQHVVEALREIRYLLENDTVLTDVGELVEAVLRHESLAEHIEQLLLADRAAVIFQHKVHTPIQKLANACKSLVSYCCVMQVRLELLDGNVIKAMLAATFPEIDPNKICKAWRDTVIKCKELQQYSRAQLSLAFE